MPTYDEKPQMSGPDVAFEVYRRLEEYDLLVDRTLAPGGKLLITADHGNCEQMRNPDGSPHTAHTTNLVHFLYAGADADHVRLENGILADVAPTLLALLGVPQPAEMTGRSLIVKK